MATTHIFPSSPIKLSSEHMATTVIACIELARIHKVKPPTYIFCLLYNLKRCFQPAGFFFVLIPNRKVSIDIFLDCVRWNIAVWGLTMAAFSRKLAFPDYGVLLLKTSFTAFIMRSSACTINDILDQKFDASVGEFIFGTCQVDYS